MAPATIVAAHGSSRLDDSLNSQPPSNQPNSVEMTDLKKAGLAEQDPLGDVSVQHASPRDNSFAAAAGSSNVNNENARPEQSSAAAISASHETTNPLSSPAKAPEPSHPEPLSSAALAITRLDSVAIGPSTDTLPAPATSDTGPVVVITLLLTSGARHPYKIDEKYLTKRSVNVPGVTQAGRKDPFSISVYTLKELILREWREEWEAQPSSPSSIRLIYFGRLLDDKTALKECKFNAESANVVHMTVRPQDIVDEEDASKSKAMARGRDGEESTAGCHCVIL